MRKSLAKVNPNPFRHMDRYPIKRDKIEALKKSINDTDFWENIVAREGKGGTIEIAYGHHRLTALNEIYGPRKQFDFIVKDLSDTDMARIMAHENMEEWGSQADVEQETIRAIVEGYAEGLIDLPLINSRLPKSQVRYAPSFTPGSTHGHDHEYPYTIEMLVEFLGWTRSKVEIALQSLFLIEQEFLSEDDYKGLTQTEAKAVNRETAEVARRVKAQEKQLAKKFKGNEKAQKQAAKSVNEYKKRTSAVIREAVNKSKQSDRRGGSTLRENISAAKVSAGTVTKKAPDINAFVPKVARQLNTMLDEDSALATQLNAIIKHKKKVSSSNSKVLLAALDALITNASTFKKRLK